MNETLLNLSVLQQEFDKHFSDRYTLKYWFAKLLHSSTVMGITEEYRNFGELAQVALENLFYENNIPLSEEVKDDILGAFRKLPAYDDVKPSLMMLQEKGIKTIAVSNSSLEMIKQQLSNADIIHLFDAYYSVDAVNTYKPFPNIYEYVVKKESLKPNNTLMVATHDWDLFGAKKVGLKTAYIERKRELYNPFYAKADYHNSDLIQLIKAVTLQ